MDKLMIFHMSPIPYRYIEKPISKVPIYDTDTDITISPIYQRYFLYVDPPLVAYANPVDAAAAR